MLKNCRIIGALLLLIVTSTLQAQDFLLSQIWSAPTYVAPSFAGLTYGGRVFTTYRNQWSSIKGTQTALVGYDQYFHPIRSSFGAQVSYTSNAGGALSQTVFNIQYNYAVKMSKKWFFRPGLQLGIFYRHIDTNKLLFMDQFSLDGNVINPSSFQPVTTSLFRFDAAASIMFHGPYVLAGLNVAHLLGNNVSFTDAPETRQPVKLNTFVVGMIPISRSYGRFDPKDDVTIAALYQWQGQYHQIDLDVMYHRRYLMAGVGYRGIPFYAPSGYTNSDAVKFMIGGSIEGFSLSYSYDLSISSLVNVSGGSHEVCLSYRFLQKAPNDRSFFCY